MARSMSTIEDAAVAAVALDDPDFPRQLVQHMLQHFLEAEMTAHLGAARYERSDERQGHRNGYKPRQLHTRVGTLSLRVPQDRGGTFSTQLFARYRRSEKALVLALMEMYIEGLSTRKVAEVTEALCGTTFSKSLISELAGTLDTDLTAWRECPLTATGYPYHVVDARYEHVRAKGQVVSQGVLIVSAIRDDGRRESLAAEIADTESEATYHDLFRRLRQRGLAGVRLVTSDDHAGLRAAIARHFQGAGWQRSQVHFARGLLGMVGASKRREPAAGLRQVFVAATRAQALAAAQHLADEWRGSHPKVALALEDDIEPCLACLAFPPAHQPRLRTTSGLERLNQELNRRTRVVRIFPNRASCLRLVRALCMEQSEEWVSGRISASMGQSVESPGTAPGRGSPLARESQ